MAPPGPDRDFRIWLLTQFAEGHLSAKRTCIGAYQVGGLAEAANVADIARDPKAQSGSFNKFLDSKLGLDQFAGDVVFTTKIPQHTKQQGRKLMPHPFLPPHRQIDDQPDEFTCDQKL